jgi:hypothetical protein
MTSQTTMLDWVARTWRGELGVARSTVLLSGLGAFALGSLADSGMQEGIAAGGLGYLLYAVCALAMTGFAVLAMVAVIRAARRHPGLGADLAIAFALLQSVLLLGDVALYSLAAIGLAPSPAAFITDKLKQLNDMMNSGV